MAAPTFADVGALLGDGAAVTEQKVTAALTVVTAMASAYTRGLGFTGGVPNDEIRAVILTATCRLVSNSSGLVLDLTEGPSAVSYRSTFSGWTSAELYVLNRYRVRAG